MQEFSERKEKILRAVIVEHVVSAEPVASEVIAHKYDLGVGSATVRNEMAAITEQGLLEQPHTSAGRVPSDRGYRYFVDRLVVFQPLPQLVQGKIQAATQEEETLKDLVTETTKALSRATRMLSAALTVRDAGITVKHVTVTAMGPERGLLILILQNGHTETRLIDLPKEMTLDDVGRVNEALVAQWKGRSLSDLSTLKPGASDNGTVERALRTCLNLGQAVAKDLMRGYLVTEGEEYIFSQPEFTRSPEAISGLVTSMEDQSALISALGTGASGDAVEISIGKENPSPELRSLTLMKQKFFAGNCEAGTIAILGPTRMDYERNLSTLEFTANAMTDTLTKLFS